MPPLPPTPHWFPSARLPSLVGTAATKAPGHLLTQSPPVQDARALLCVSFMGTDPESPCISHGSGKEAAARSQNLPEVNMAEGLFKDHEQKSEADRRTERCRAKGEQQQEPLLLPALTGREEEVKFAPPSRELLLGEEVARQVPPLASPRGNQRTRRASWGSA